MIWEDGGEGEKAWNKSFLCYGNSQQDKAGVEYSLMYKTSLNAHFVSKKDENDLPISGLTSLYSILWAVTTQSSEEKDSKFSPISIRKVSNKPKK